MEGHAMSNVRIVLDRQDNGLWSWVLTARGEQYTGPRPMPSAELAAQEAETHRRLIHLSRDFKKNRIQREAI
jgi:hypothetical protein